jgi:LmbE family N-acetylglucosaminyl deacetylase
MNGTMLGVWAHPDDETYLSGGLMAMLATRGERVVCTTATSGEHGTDDPQQLPPELLAQIRTHELTDAMRRLGVTEIVRLGHADGGCAHLDRQVGAAQIARVITSVAPRTIVTFGPDGVTGHPDHIAVSHWVDEACAMLGPAAPHVLHPAITRRVLEQSLDVYECLGLDPTIQPISDDDEIAIELRLPDDVLARKVAALRAHTSQTAVVFEALGETRVAEWLRVEQFVDAPRAVPTVSR